MPVPDMMCTGEIATELIKQLGKVCKKCVFCRSSAEQLMTTIEALLPTIQEIKYSGVELPQLRQTQLDQLSRTLISGQELASKVLLSSRYNFYNNLRYSRKMEKIEKAVSRFISGPLQAHLLADVHHLRAGMSRLEESIGGMRIGSGVGFDGGWLDLGEAMRRKEEEEARNRERGSCVNLVGAEMVLAKKKVKEMVVEGDDSGAVLICGIGGSGKTTLATEISRDPTVRSHYNDRVFFFTVSQSPNVEELKQKLRIQTVNGNGNTMVDVGSPAPPWQQPPPQCNWLQYDWGSKVGRTLVILDDVWSLPVLEELMSCIPGCKTLVVSRFKFPGLNCTYEVQLLREEEALSLFCYYAFGQKTLPFSADEKLVNQVVKECKGLPLALKVIGAALRGQPEMFWRSAMYSLSRGKPISDSHEIKLLERMAISIDYLPPKVKECFIDLAAFPEDKKIPLDVLINMWVEIHDLDEEEAFAILIELSDKNLITLVKDARAGDKYSSYFEISVTIHDVLRDMALHLSNKDSLNERRRLLMPRREKGIPREWERNMDKPFQAQIVSIHTGEMKESDWFSMDFPKAEVLILNFSSSEYYMPPFISRMPKLRALVLINYGNSSVKLDNLSVFSSMSNLRSLWLEKVCLPRVPVVTVPMSNLRKISLVLCEFDSFGQSMLDAPQMLPRLSELTMDHCIGLINFPSNICTYSSLKSLSVTNCHDLHGLPTDLGKLNSLRILRFCACPALEKLPDSICCLVKLEYLDLSQCVNLRSLPDCLGQLSRLEKIDMRECLQIRTLPASVLALRGLRRVICDEEASWLWKEVEMVAPELHVEVAEECFNMDWISE